MWRRGVTPEYVVEGVRVVYFWNVKIASSFNLKIFPVISFVVVPSPNITRKLASVSRSRTWRPIIVDIRLLTDSEVK